MADTNKNNASCSENRSPAASGSHQISAFTPGPWTVEAMRDDIDIDAPGSFSFIGVEAGGEDRPYPIALVMDEYGERDSLHANAHLIASAPALYAALEKAKRYVGMVRSDALPGDDPVFAVMYEIDAALRSARGEAA